MSQLDCSSRRAIASAGLWLCVIAMLFMPLAVSPREIHSLHHTKLRDSLQDLLVEPLPKSNQLEPPSVVRDPFKVPAGIDSALHLLANGGATRVAAIVIGEHASAILKVAGETQLVRVGDRVGSSEVLRIDSEGVHLSAGVTLVPPEE